MDMVASGDALYVIAREYGATPGALARWLGEDQDRALAFSKARESAAHVYASAVVAVACDDARLEGDRRVRISALQWAAAKFAPRVYGERLDITTNDAPISDVADVEARLSKLLIQLGESRKALKPLK